MLAQLAQAQRVFMDYQSQRKGGRIERACLRRQRIRIEGFVVGHNGHLDGCGGQNKQVVHPPVTQIKSVSRSSSGQSNSLED